MAKPHLVPLHEDAGDTTPVPPGSATQRIDPLWRQRSRDALAMVMEHRDVPALLEADALYGDDISREIEDVKAGRHPLQRAGQGLDTCTIVAAELAEIRAKLGG